MKHIKFQTHNNNNNIKAQQVGMMTEKENYLITSLVSEL